MDLVNKKISDRVDKINQKFVIESKKDYDPEMLPIKGGRKKKDLSGATQTKFEATALRGGFLPGLPAIVQTLVPIILPMVIDAISKKMSGKGSSGGAKNEMGSKEYRFLDRPNKMEMPSSDFSGGCMCDDSENEVKVIVGGKKRANKKKNLSGKLQKRALLVKKIMKDKGFSLIQASKYIKKNNIQY